MPGGHILKAFDKLDAIIDNPVVTLQGMTATEAVGKRMTMETKRRMEVVYNSSNLVVSSVNVFG